MITTDSLDLLASNPLKHNFKQQKRRVFGAFLLDLNFCLLYNVAKMWRNVEFCLQIKDTLRL